jgi:hypothetical protein
MPEEIESAKNYVVAKVKAYVEEFMGDDIEHDQAAGFCTITEDQLQEITDGRIDLSKTLDLMFDTPERDGLPLDLAPRKTVVITGLDCWYDDNGVWHYCWTCNGKLRFGEGHFFSPIEELLVSDMGGHCDELLDSVFSGYTPKISVIMVDEYRRAYWASEVQYGFVL